MRKTIKHVPYQIIAAALMIVFLWPMILLELATRAIKGNGNRFDMEAYAMCAIILFFSYCGIGLWWWFTKIVAHL